MQCPLVEVVSGSLEDGPSGVAVDASGSIYVTGPVTSGAFDTTHNGASDHFVMKLSPTGPIMYSRFVGGGSFEVTGKIALLGNQAVIVGSTTSADYPTTPGAFDRTFDGIEDIVVTKLSADGSSLVFSTFLGGAGPERGSAIGVDGAGRIIICGSSVGPYPRTPGAYSTVNA